MAAVPNSSKDCSVGTFNDYFELPDQLTNQDSKKKEESTVKRSSFSFEDKLKAINLLNSQSKDDVCTQFNLDRSTLNKWIKQSEKIKEICKNNHGKKLKKQKTTNISELDDKLYAWFLNQRARGAPLSGPILKAQALVMTQSLGIKNFKASNHWFDGWKKRKNVRLLRIQGEKLSADEPASISFKDNFQDIINKNELTRAQVFNFDESMLNFEMLPAYTFVSNSEQRASGFKKDKSRVTFAACSNADGSLKIPILIIGRSAKPRVFKSRSAETLPVFYTHSKSSWMTSAIFQNWFETEFVPKVQIFLRQKGLPIKAILLVDNCKAHVMLSVGDIKTEFFPPNITSIVQPMDQGVLETLKKKYRARLVASLVDAAKIGTSIPEHLKSITLDNVVNWISEAWDEMSSSTIYRCWRKIWPVKTSDAETQTEPTSEVLTPLDLMVENESDETMFNKLVNADEVLQSLRSFKEFACIEKVAVDSWMKKTENWGEADVEEHEKTINSDMMASNTLNNCNENSYVNTLSDFSVVRDALSVMYDCNYEV